MREWNLETILLFEQQYPLPFVSLQWFADSDDEDAPGKTEQPTEHKIQRLREEGQVVKSQEIVSALGLFLPALLILFLAPSMLRNFVELIKFFFTRVTEMDPINDRIIVLVFFRYFAILVGPILAVAFITAIFSNIIQTGFLFMCPEQDSNLHNLAAASP